MQLLKIIIFAAFANAGLHSTGFACSCRPLPEDVATNVREAFDEADVVVHAEAESVRRSYTIRSLLGIEKQQVVTWKVLTSWKGAHVTGHTIKTETVTECCACGVEVSSGEKLLLYLKRELFVVDNCSLGIRYPSTRDRQMQILTRISSSRSAAPNKPLQATREARAPER